MAGRGVVKEPRNRLVLGVEVGGADECAVEAVGDPGRQLHGSLEPHVGGVHDQELRGAGGLVAHEGQHVAVVLGAGAGVLAVHGHEARLAAEPALAVLELGELAGHQVHLGEPGHLGPRLGHGQVGVPRLPAQHVAVHHADLEVHLALQRQDGPPRGLAGARVEPDLGEHALEVVVRVVEDGVGRGHAGADHHHLVRLRLLPRVPEVEAEAVGHVHPHHLRRLLGVLGEDAEAGGLLLVEHHRRAAAEHLGELEHHLVVGHDNEVLGDGEVVDHGGLVELDLDVGGLGAVGVEVEVLEVRLLDDIVAEREELAGDGVELGVRDHGAVELAVEVVAADGLEVAGGGDADLVREVVLGHGEEAAVEVDEAGVGDAGAVGRVDKAAGAARVEQSQPRDARVAVELANGLRENRPPNGALLGEAGGLGEAAGVGLGGAVADADGVDHAVAVEEVVPGRGLEAGVGAVACVDAVDEGRDAAGDRERAHGGLLADGGEVAGDLHGGVGRARQRVGPLQDIVGEPLLEGVERRRRRALEEVEALPVLAAAALLLRRGNGRQRGLLVPGNLPGGRR
ncbi:hypothetical protein CFC21_069743 [Triticum aestivum]|uniref:Uncharacterized protein n=2 Tax=Triticum aestivum TaxID=4565 RepID=A0A9R1HC33_WHEAT|nr:hypothetical protein CFC21_069743 [Triticum aestivum]